MADEKKVTLLALLDMSSAFDTVDFQILLHRLKVSYGLEWTVRYYSGFCQTELILSRSLVVVPLLPNWTVKYPRAQYLALCCLCYIIIIIIIIVYFAEAATY